MKKSILALFLCVAGFSFCMAQSADIEAEGRGITEYEASQQALMNLAKQLEVRVATFTGGAEVVEESGTSMANASAVTTDVLVTTDLVLSGVRYKTIAPKERNDPYVVTASMLFSESRPLYLRRIGDLVQETNELLTVPVDTMNTDARELYSRELLSLVKEYHRYRSVAGIMGIPRSDIPAFPIQLVQAETKVKEAVQVVDSLDRGVKKLVQALAVLQTEGAKVTIGMPVLVDTAKSGTLGVAFYNRLTAGLVGAGISVYEDAAKSRYLIKSTYTKPNSAKDTLVLSVQVVLSGGKDAGQIMKAVSVELTGTAGAGYTYE